MPPARPAPSPPASAELGEAAVRRAGARLVVAAVFFGLMAVGTKAVSQALPGPEVAFLRMVFGVLLFAVVAVRQPSVLHSRRPKWLAARGLFGGLSVLFYFVSIEKVGVGLATLIHYSAPVWAAVLGYLVLGERVSVGMRLAMAVAFKGVALVMGPTLVQAWQQGASGQVAPGWYLLSLGSAVISAGALVAVRAGRRAQSTATGEQVPADGEWTLFGGFSLFGALAAAPFAVPPVGNWVWPSPQLWGLVLGVSAVSVVAQLIMTRALAHVSAAAPGVANQLAVVIAAAGGIVFFGERLTLIASLGALLIMAGVILNLRAAAPVTVTSALQR